MTPTHPRRRPLALALLGALSLPAMAASPATDTHPHGEREARRLDAVVVTATPLKQTADDLARPVEVLSDADLDRAKRATLGDTLQALPGVQSASFGPGVGRPVIRGLDGARVQVLSDGLGAGDVSAVSVDHANSVEPFLADRIEVLKGPATLLYGSGAIGGAINVIDGRVPDAPTARPLQGRAELRGNSVNDETAGLLRLDGTAADGRLVFHLDALHREGDDYAIPGYAERPDLHAHDDDAHDDHDDHADEAVRGTLPNSVLRTDAGAFGLSWIGERGHVGAAYSLYSTRYGVPGHTHAPLDGHDDHGHAADDDHADEAGHDDAVHIDLDQRRGEARAGLDDVGVFETVRLKLARTDYTHTEFEGDAVGTVFENTTREGRLELVHQPFAGWRGALGLQWTDRDFDAVGDEAFVPGTRGRDAGLFWIGERDFGPLKLELGARADRNRITPDAPAHDAHDDHDHAAHAERRDFDAHSLSAALKWDLDARLHLSLGLDHAERSPTAEELFSRGYHVATGALELGSDNLDVEAAQRIELGAHWHGERLRVGAALFAVEYADFIYLSALESGAQPGTALTMDGVPVRLWTQGDARFHGAEFDARLNLLDDASGRWDLRLRGDWVRGRLTGDGVRSLTVDVPHGDHAHAEPARLALGGDLPRIAPARLGTELEWSRGGWRATLGAMHHARQDRVAAWETPSAGYTLIDAHLSYHWDADTVGWEVFLDGSNLTDREARPHTSVLKDLAPLPGRGFALGIRAFF